MGCYILAEPASCRRRNWPHMTGIPPVKAMELLARWLARTLSVAVGRFRAIHRLRHGHIADRARYSRER
jgi:hypothetical protein